MHDLEQRHRLRPLGKLAHAHVHAVVPMHVRNQQRAAQHRCPENRRDKVVQDQVARLDRRCFPRPRWRFGVLGSVGHCCGCTATTSSSVFFGCGCGCFEGQWVREGEGFAHAMDPRQVWMNGWGFQGRIENVVGVVGTVQYYCSSLSHESTVGDAVLVACRASANAETVTSAAPYTDFLIGTVGLMYSKYSTIATFTSHYWDHLIVKIVHV